MSNIEEDVKTIKYRVDKCREEFEDFGEISFAYSDLDRIENILSEREQDKKKIKELEEHLKKYYDGELYTAKQLKQIEENQKKYFINKQKVKDEIERYEYMIAETIHGKIQKYTPGEILLKIDTLKELLEEK